MPLIGFSSRGKGRSLLLLGFLVLASVFLFAQLHQLQPVIQNTPVIEYTGPPTTVSAAEEEHVPVLPAPYTTVPDKVPFCAERFETKYLEKLRDSATQYCNESQALTCFHSQVVNRWDSFCFGKKAKFLPEDGKFQLDCNLTCTRKTESNSKPLELNVFHKYWYDTVPSRVLDGLVKMKHEAEFWPQKSQNYTILVKRKSATNLWHSLLEIYSMLLSLDVLHMTLQPNMPSTPFISKSDAENTQVVILDDHEDGPYYELWSLFAKKQVVRMKNVSPNTRFENIIVPLGGESNPLWQGDWEINTCKSSALLNTFVNRVLAFYSLQKTKHRQSDKLTLTFIDGVGGQRLVDQEKYLKELQNYFPLVNIQLIDFAAISFREQLKIIQQTDVLAGVHGAGLAHGTFLPPGSVMVEILPNTPNHKGFRNMASLMGHSYFSTGVSKMSKKPNWHSEDNSIEIETFLAVMKLAIKTMYNKNLRNYDAS
ncbi:hypothetical protein N7509_013021 [Penicillium cosmopolitanum]|uniref:EGF domain-specific O-linked N-acetylglucosamine transferase n=1 Tax=Penicillium cosmopolitanum TaxID=1131564 RepID=A0A9W9VE32_9EURO|nr:uncharacterized protein N7509_013021 [Penicillium cosmopolitanum]KAJ5376135.1 hypothetical protein N7509_013021 [Penicillium cosmopolitanum]